MPNIAQQDYLIFYCGGESLETLEADFSAFLKKIYQTNPMSLLSVVAKDMGSELDSRGTLPVVGYYIAGDGSTLTVFLGSLENSFEVSMV